MYRKKHSIYRIQLEVLRHLGFGTYLYRVQLDVLPHWGFGTYLYRVQLEVLPSWGLEHIYIGFSLKYSPLGVWNISV